MCRLFTEFWKRKQARCAMQWGMCGFEEQEQTRPQYRGIRYAKSCNNTFDLNCMVEINECSSASVSMVPRFMLTILICALKQVPPVGEKD